MPVQQYHSFDGWEDSDAHREDGLETASLSLDQERSPRSEDPFAALAEYYVAGVPCLAAFLE